jgi:hypothetical protein
MRLPEFSSASPCGPLHLLRARAKSGAGSKWVLAVTQAEPFRPHLRGWKRWSGASPSRGGLEGDASAVSNVATKLAPIGSPSVASITVTADLQLVVLLDLQSALHLLVLLALRSPGPRLCANHHRLPRHLPLPRLVGMPLSASFGTPTCRPSLLLCARSSSSLLRIILKR